jgi:hypothetical protein
MEKETTERGKEKARKKKGEKQVKCRKEKEEKFAKKLEKSQLTLENTNIGSDLRKMFKNNCRVFAMVQRVAKTK